MGNGNLIQLTVESRPVHEGRFSLSYRAHNASGKEIYLFNRLFRADKTGKRAIDKDKVYCVVVGDTVHLSKRLVRVPEGTLVESPEVPYLTHLPPGASFEEGLSLALPLRLDIPYLHPSASVVKPVLCRELVFTLGYFVAKEQRWVRTITKNGEPVLVTDYGFAVLADEVVSASTAEVKIPCLEPV
jgi:hypothetical protein